jgi:hypothetical protein
MELTEQQIKRFWNKVYKKEDDECWEWKTSLDKGYGRVMINNKLYLSHRVSYYLANGNLPEPPLIIRHKCLLNRKCCNPNHLESGTKKDNSDDSIIRDKTYVYLNGELNGFSKLTEIQVLEIRAKYIPFKYKARKLADEYKVKVETINAIVQRKSWKHI